jgi:metal-responsive CopG/Arc/MetJ family transcriptional regulator
MTKLTIEVPEQLAEQLNDYLKAHPEESIAELLDEALQIKLTPKDSTKLLNLAGIVTDAPRGAADHAEDFQD